MSHARQQIRDTIVTTLTGATDAGTKVYNSKVYPQATLPAINVTTSRETVGDEVMGGKQLRYLTVEIDCRAKGNATYANALDTLSAQVEVAIQADPTLGGKVEDCEYQGMNVTFDGGQDEIVGVLSVEYLVWYLVNEADPTTLLT